MVFLWLWVEVALAAGGGTFPLRYQVAGSQTPPRVHAPCRFDDRWYPRCLLDTATPRTNLPLGDPLPSGHTGFDQPKKVHARQLAFLSRKVPLGGPIQVSGFGKGLPLIGGDLLAKHRVCFNFPEKIGSLQDNSSIKLRRPLKVVKGIPLIEVCFKKQCLEAIWDTAASHSAIDRSWIKKIPSLKKQQEAKVLANPALGSSKDQATDFYESSSVSIGGVAIEPTARFVAMSLEEPTRKLGHPVAMILGFEVLRSFVWILDYPQKKFAMLLLSATNPCLNK